MKYKYYNKDLNDAYNDGYLTAQKEDYDKILNIQKEWQEKEWISNQELDIILEIFEIIKKSLSEEKK